MFGNIYIKVGAAIILIFMAFTLAYVKFGASYKKDRPHLETENAEGPKGAEVHDYFSVFRFVNNFNPSK